MPRLTYFSDVVERKDPEDNGSLEQVEEGEERDEPKPRALHKTHSLFLRSLAPTISKQDIEAVGLTVS